MTLQWYLTLRSLRTALGEEEKKRSIKEVGEGLALLEDAFNKSRKGKAFFGGDQIGFLDIALGCFLAMLRVTEDETFTGVKFLDQANTPELAKWADRFCAHGAVKDLMPETGKLLAYAKMRRAKTAASAPK